jgi:N utilization substance protein A
MKISFDSNTIKTMSLFQTLTKANLKDCFAENDSLVFVVLPGEMGRAIGKNASNVRRISEMLKRKIKIVEFNENVIEFIKNIIHPLKLMNIEESEGTITLTAIDSKTRGMLIGRAAENLRRLESQVRRYFDVKEIKVA